MRKNSGGVNRSDRVNAEIIREISEIISRKLKDPLITAMVSVTGADVSKDLSYAKIFVSVFSTDENKKRQTFDALKTDAKKIRYELSRSMRMRTVPELDFVLDLSMEYGDKMDKILYKIAEDEKN